MVNPLRINTAQKLHFPFSGWVITTENQPHSIHTVYRQTS